ncbi:MAG: hypothetical protein WC444_06585 [Candidatus Paceibacterota bacterium]
MCGIIGAHIKEFNGNTIKLLINLFNESKIRGLHSFGIAYYNHEGHICVEKSHTLDALTLVSRLAALSNGKFIFHCRYSTSGDWTNHNNNQPIYLLGIGAIAVNGVICMDDKETMEKKYNVVLETANDAEILLKKLEQMELMSFIKNESSASVAATLLSGNDVYAFRNNKRPLYIYNDNKAENRIAVSTLDIILRAGGNKDCVSILKPYNMCTL